MATHKPEYVQTPLPRPQDAEDSFGFWVVEIQNIIEKLQETHQDLTRRLEQESLVLQMENVELRRKCKHSHDYAENSLRPQLHNITRSPPCPEIEERGREQSMVNVFDIHCFSDSQHEPVSPSTNIKPTSTSGDTHSNTSGFEARGSDLRNSVSRQQSEDRRRLWKKFQKLDSDGGGSITAGEILNWREEAEPALVRGPHDEADLEHTIETFNTVMNVDTDERINEITFSSFCCLMNPSFLSVDTSDKLGSDLYESLTEIRELLKNKTGSHRASSIIADAIDVARADLKQQIFEAETKTFDVTKYLEPISACVIISNTITLGVQVDVKQNWEGWRWIESCYACFYVAEILIKLRADGWRKYFTGRDLLWNYFDIFIVAAAVFELVSPMFGGMIDVDLSNFVLVRMTRLARLSRLIRLLRVRAFKELNLMFSGILGGFRVLAWAIVLFALVVYTTSLVLRLTVGSGRASEMCQDTKQCPRSDVHFASFHDELFSSMPRTMLTVYRCFIQGCDSLDGTPLIPHLYNKYGLIVLLSYVLATFFVIFGVFNVMTAIFVEQTYETSKADKLQAVRQTNTSVKAVVILQSVVLRICGIARQDTSAQSGDWVSRIRGSVGLGPKDFDDSELESVAQQFSNLNCAVTRSRFLRVLREDPEVRNMLHSLDITVIDSQHLFDLLDADGSGALEPEEVVTGLMKLRGMKDAGYQVASLLGLRALQRHVRDVHNLLMQTTKTIRLLKTSQTHSKQVRLQSTTSPLD